MLRLTVWWTREGGRRAQVMYVRMTLDYKEWKINMRIRNKFSVISNPQKSIVYILNRLFITSRVYLEPPSWPAPSWLVSSVGRALHRYRRGRGFKSRTGLNFFHVLFTTTSFSSVLSCEDLLISSLHRSANMWIFIYLNVLKCLIV